MDHGLQVIYDEVEFPAVSFCNLNPIRRNQLTLEQNINLTELVATLDQATSDQLSGRSQTSRRRRRRRRRRVPDAEVGLYEEGRASDLERMRWKRT